MIRNYRFICYGKKKSNLDLSISALVIGSKSSTFITKISNGDIIFLYANGLIHGIAEVCSEGFINNEQIWRDNIYPYRFQIKNVHLLPAPLDFKTTEECQLIREELGTHWGYKVLFTPNKLPIDIGKSLHSLLESKIQNINQ